MVRDQPGRGNHSVWSEEGFPEEVVTFSTEAGDEEVTKVTEAGEEPLRLRGRLNEGCVCVWGGDSGNPTGFILVWFEMEAGLRAPEAPG